MKSTGKVKSTGAVAAVRLLVSCVVVVCVVTSRAFPESGPPGFPGMRCVEETTSCGLASQHCVGSGVCEWCDGNTTVNTYCEHAHNATCVPFGSVYCGTQYSGTCNISTGMCSGSGNPRQGCSLASPCTGGSGG
jgi:hypothetical protein